MLKALAWQNNQLVEGHYLAEAEGYAIFVVQSYLIQIYMETSMGRGGQNAEIDFITYYIREVD